jgi:predicted lipid carrier protein YhbT
MANATTLSESRTEPITGTDPIERFFAELDRRGHEPLLDHATAILRFDIIDGDQLDNWLVRVNHGLVRAVHANGEADCAVRISADLFAACVSGQANATAAFLRGQITVRGDAELLVNFQRLFPSPVRPGEVVA